MRVEWDIEKAKTNLVKHNVSFQEASQIFLDQFMLTVFDPDHSGEEDRYITLGQTLSGNVLLVIHTYQQPTETEFIRIISARKTTKREVEYYYSRRRRK